ncbi:MAG: hypothetical protein K9N23_11135 [Akkermansiaceae bacterium]|nr:hypothetical protein [Akkermansiaceae bacterium]
MSHHPSILPLARQTAIVAILCGTLMELPAQTYVHDARLDERSHDLHGPFNYFLTPSDALGFMDAPKAFQLTGDGACSANWGELTLWAGTPLKRLNSRVRTLDHGCLPVINYGSLVDGIEYRVKAFAAPVGLDPRANLLAFVRITATNPGKAPRRAAIGARVFDHEGPWRQPFFDHTKPLWWAERFIDQATWQPWKLWEPTEVRPHGEVHRTESKHLIFHYQPDQSGWQVLEAAANVEPFEFVIQLAPGQSASVDVTVPWVPVADARTGQVKAVADAGFDDYLARSRQFWQKQLNPGVVFEVPEQKVMEMHKASLMYDLMARDLQEDGKTHIQTVSDVQYNRFFSRDAAFIIHTYDMLGLPKIAAECIEHVLLKDGHGKPAGLLATHPDAWGQALWTLAAHYRITGDQAFAEYVYPAVPGHIAKLEAETAKDPWGLWPVAGPYDNERIDGHYTGHSFWVLRGLQDAAELATAVGKPDDARRFQKLYDDYRARFMIRLKAITDKTGGYIPPGLDDPLAGMDWENASGGVYPFGVISAADPMVKNTVQTVRDYAYQEGIMTYEHNAFKVRQAKEAKGADWSQPEHTVIHHYETFQVLQTLLALGMDREVVTDFYSFLVHTGSTHTGFEYDIWAWRDRNFHNNYPPHGWCAARFNECLRNMLVREDMMEPVLHLASALAPSWLEAGRTVRVTKAPTDFGVLSYTINATEGGAKVSLEAQWRKAPDSLRFHIPWFVDLRSAKVDGRVVEARDRVLEVPADARQLDLQWTRNAAPADLSYRKGVERYVDRYWKIQHGEPIPGFDSRWIFPE